MPAPTILIQDHREDSHSIDLAPYDDPEVLSSGLSAANQDFFIFFGVTEKGDSGPTIGWVSVDEPGFSQTYGPSGTDGVVQAFGNDSFNFSTGRSEFATLDSDIASGSSVDIRYNQAFSRSVENRVYIGLKWNVGLLDQPYPNTPTGFSDIISFDAYDNTIGTSTSPSITMPAGDRYWTRTPGLGNQGRPGMLMGWVGWDASGGASFSASAPWIQAINYQPASTYGIAVYYQYFGPDDADHTFSGTLSSSTEWQAEISAYKAFLASGPIHLEGSRHLSLNP